MPRYRKSADKDVVIIPGVGRVAPGQILDGLEYQRFADLGLLEEIKGAAPPQPVTSLPKEVKVQKGVTVSVPDPVPVIAPDIQEISPPKSSGVEIPDTSEIEDPDLRRGWKTDEEKDVGEPDEVPEETDDSEEAKLKKRAEVRRKGSRKKK
jgi:hypothetical protein